MTALTLPGHRKKPKTWPAVTRYKRLGAARGLTLVEVEMVTGVTHQIRVHLAAIGHPIVADSLYGDPAADTLGLHRHFLHAGKLAFARPSDGRIVKVCADLPVELRGVLNGLGLKC
jgi:23S rRNA pseudouridine1911/1915/1917 synthase